MKSRLVFAFIATISLLPLGVLAIYSIAPGWTFPNIIPTTFDFRALHFLVQQAGPISRHMTSSIGYSLLTVICTFVISVIPAHHFARRHFSGKTLLEGIFLAPALVPAMTFSMGVHWLFIQLELADTFIGVVLVLTIFSYPYMLRALTAGYQSFGEEYALCAKNLGAGPFYRFFRVEFPLLFPSIIAGGSVVFLVAFSEYFLVFLIGGGAVDSFTGYLVPYLTSSDRSIGSIMTLVFLVVSLTLFALVEWIVSRTHLKRGTY